MALALRDWQALKPIKQKWRSGPTTITAKIRAGRPMIEPTRLRHSVDQVAGCHPQGPVSLNLVIIGVYDEYLKIVKCFLKATRIA